MILIGILVPWLALMLEGHTVPAAVCFGLQLTVIGLIPAAVWGCLSAHGSASVDG